jgi:hypothetical protein
MAPSSETTTQLPAPTAEALENDHTSHHAKRRARSRANKKAKRAAKKGARV